MLEIPKSPDGQETRLKKQGSLSASPRLKLYKRNPSFPSPPISPIALIPIQSHIHPPWHPRPPSSRAQCAWAAKKSSCTAFPKLSAQPVPVLLPALTSPRPNFTLTMLRPAPQTPATHASFIVPLNLNKLDLRDYLYNVYSVRCLGVRSYILQQKLRQDKAGAKRPAQRKWHRPRSIKKMIVELESPFVWPSEPEDFKDWDKETFDAAQEDNKKQQQSWDPASKKKPTRERGAIKDQARRILQGEEDWRPTRVEEWEDFGEPVEVEQNVVLPKE